ncbi:hypothetical protein [Micrococcus sp.]|uniref:hypothetical protein n=1 Tax=Micrococcus sp. TaxID=1271 RepID=UPI002A917D1C|nr:hypothetical protein [Micrococcus sp.]MDY6054920.1 hypothetical protein [Micrococcus sp.]
MAEDRSRPSRSGGENGGDRRGGYRGGRPGQGAARAGGARSGGARDGRRQSGRGRDDAPRGYGRGDGGQRRRPQEGAERRERPAHNPRDLRAANRVDQQRSPDIDADVTGKELDRGTLKEIGGLDERQAGWVAKHLVMAGRLLDEDPALAFQHALAASRKGGRLSRVREAVALTAYAAGEYGEALREFRTYRRMTGDSTHIAAQVDSERALGRLEKALQLAAEVDTASLDRAARVELAMVVSGVREDLGDLAGALEALRIPELDRRRGYPFSPRLFQRQADVLTALGRAQEAAQWRRAVQVAEKALGLGGYADPEIMDLQTEAPVEEDSRPRGGRDTGRSRPRTDGPARREERDARPESATPTGAPAQGEAVSQPEPAEHAEGADQVPDAPASTEDATSAAAPTDEVDPRQMSLFDEPSDTPAGAEDAETAPVAEEDRP